MSNYLDVIPLAEFYKLELWEVPRLQLGCLCDYQASQHLRIQLNLVCSWYYTSCGNDSPHLQHVEVRET